MYVKRIPNPILLRFRFITANNKFEPITNTRTEKEREKNPQQFQLVD